jgi:hypothetical protein
MTLAKSSCVGGASCADVSAAVRCQRLVGGWRGKADGEKRTQRNVVVWVHGDILAYLDVVDGFENGEAVADTAHAQLLQLGVL